MPFFAIAPLFGAGGGGGGGVAFEVVDDDAEGASPFVAVLRCVATPEPFPADLP